MILITEQELSHIKETLLLCKEEIHECTNEGVFCDTGAMEMIFDSVDIINGLLSEEHAQREMEGDDDE